MTAFPPSSWEIWPLADMDKMAAIPREGSQFSMQPLLAVAPADGIEGTYKFLLAGINHVTMKVPVRRILPDPSFSGMSIEMQLELGTQITLGKNSTCTAWVDVVELVQSNDADVVDSAGLSIADEFLQAIRDYRAAKPEKNAGISWRWALSVCNREPILTIQSAYERIY